MTQLTDKEVAEFVGEGYDFVNVHNVFGNRFRIDCYKYYSEGVVTRREIVKSYFVYYTEDGIVDKTIHEDNKKPLF